MSCLDRLLQASDLLEFQNLVAESGQYGAQVVWLSFPASGVAVFAVCDQGQMLTWYATPTRTHKETRLAETVILSGLSFVATNLQDVASSLGLNPSQKH